MTCPTYYLLLLPLSSAGDEKHFWFRRAPELPRDIQSALRRRASFVWIPSVRAFSLMDREEENWNVYETVRRLLHGTASQFWFGKISQVNESF